MSNNRLIPIYDVDQEVQTALKTKKVSQLKVGDRITVGEAVYTVEYLTEKGNKYVIEYRTAAYRYGRIILGLQEEILIV